MSFNIMFLRKTVNVRNTLNRLPFNLNTNSILKYSINSSNHYDVVIAGGGMVGTTLACTLGKNTKFSDRRILLLESGKKFKWQLKEQYSNRVSALNPSTYNLLDRVGAWKHITDVRYGSVKRMQVWDALSDAMITFNHDELSEMVAYIVENDVLLAAVGKELEQLQNVTTINEAKIKEYQLPKKHEDTSTINMEDGTTYTCNVLLGCDGANSLVRKTMGVHYVSWNYNQKGIVATVKLSEDTENVVAWQRFLPTGPVALLPLTNKLSSLVWSTTTEHAKTLLGLSEEQFVDALNEAIWKTHQQNSMVTEAMKTFNKCLDFIQLPSSAVRQLPPSISGVEPGSRAAFPLGFGHASNYITKGVALVGDAAHRVHPLAGQGVNLGFGDVNTLDRILGEAIYSGSSLGSLNYLKQYESERQQHNVPTMLAIDGLHKLYNTEFTPVVILRSLGLQFTHALNPLKKAIIQHAAQ
ncbi:hypothetical protein ILUMI_09075 [Ignelater luminosus]|uniref:Ubiquinone biosynthesis monooxygenase COQ6, mitochondrial n=1 Tax=Ignelater luminosus TaxID=2038154 RepID=A0A8K0D349_IGNLU|nr:hypothetical protein ILUMI_09075 [Ignelater luminosus]